MSVPTPHNHPLNKAISGLDAPPDNAIRAKIVQYAGDLFFQFGASKVTMEEIADRLGMSKKTLYKFFTSKDELLAAVLDEFHCAMQNIVEPLLQAAFHADNEQFVSTMVKLGDSVATVITRNQKSPLFNDIQRNYPVLWERIEERKRTTMTMSLRSMLQQGMERGLFRADVNYDVFLLVYLSAMQEILNPTTLATLPLTAGDAYKMVISIIFGGALTDEGRIIASHFPLVEQWMNGIIQAFPTPTNLQMGSQAASGAQLPNDDTTHLPRHEPHPFLHEGLVEIT
jgi:AcrR family transcriptional regulator